MKIKKRIGDIIAWWFIGGFIGGSLGAIVMGVVGVDSGVIASFVMITIVLPIFVALIWFFFIEKDVDLKSEMMGKRSPV